MAGKSPFDLAYLAFDLPMLTGQAMMTSMWRGMAGLNGRGEPAGGQEPQWASEHRIALLLDAVTLRDFSGTTPAEPAAESPSPGIPTLVLAPYSLHNAAVADIAPGHSLMATLRDEGLARLFLVDWHSATRSMRYRTIDDCLADLNVLVDSVGTPVDLVGLCQGGWLGLIYAARFPGKVRRIVLAGAPIDLQAGSSRLSALAASVPLHVFEEFVNHEDGLVLGEDVHAFWSSHEDEAAVARQSLQIGEARSSDDADLALDSYAAWNRSPINLPGAYYLEVVHRIFHENQLVGGRFVALGRTIDLGAVRSPVYMLAAEQDDTVAREQIFATEHLVGTPEEKIAKAIAPGNHLSLMMGQKTLREVWPKIVRWLRAPSVQTVPAKPKPAAAAPRRRNRTARER